MANSQRIVIKTNRYSVSLENSRPINLPNYSMETIINPTNSFEELYARSCESISIMNLAHKMYQDSMNQVMVSMESSNANSSTMQKIETFAKNVSERTVGAIKKAIEHLIEFLKKIIDRVKNKFYISRLGYKDKLIQRKRFRISKLKTEGKKTKSNESAIPYEATTLDIDSISMISTESSSPDHLVYRYDRDHAMAVKDDASDMEFERIKKEKTKYYHDFLGTIDKLNDFLATADPTTRDFSNKNFPNVDFNMYEMTVENALYSCFKERNINFENFRKYSSEFWTGGVGHGQVYNRLSRNLQYLENLQNKLNRDGNTFYGSIARPMSAHIPKWVPVIYENSSDKVQSGVRLPKGARSEQLYVIRKYIELTSNYATGIIRTDAMLNQIYDRMSERLDTVYDRVENYITGSLDVKRGGSSNNGKGNNGKGNNGKGK